MTLDMIFAVMGKKGQKLRLSDISSALGRPPDEGVEEGERFSSDGGIKTRPVTIWCCRSQLHISSSSSEEHARCLLDLLEPAQEGLARYLLDDKVQVWMSLSWDAADADVVDTRLSSETLARLSKVCKEIRFTVEPPDETGVIPRGGLRRRGVG